MDKAFTVSLCNPDKDTYVTLELPADPYAVLDAWERLRLAPDTRVEWEMEDYGEFPVLFPGLQSGEGFPALNALAERLTSLDSRQRTAFEGLVKLQDGRPMEPDALITLSEQAKHCQVAPEATDDASLGRVYAANGSIPEVKDVPDKVFELLDFQLLGRRIRQSAGGVFTKQGYVLDKSRLINGQIFDEDYFDHLISEIQEIRASERRFYQKITDIYATAVDYSLNSQTTKDFFATVQNKMHYAVHGGTAAEVIMARADHTKEHMGLTSWKNAPDGKIVKADVSVAKNYLSMDEMQELNEIVTMYLDYATRQARRHIPMTMADWASKLDAFLQFNDAEILQNKGKVTAAIAKAFAESEFEQYRVIQDQLYQSDFDRLVASTEQKN